MDNDELKIAAQKLINLERMAGETVSPFAKAKLAEKAIGVAVEVLCELIDREVNRGG